MTKALGILLTNTGTPDSPTVADVRSYLKTFLSDPRVVRIPPIIWKPLLNLVILRLRAPFSAKLYQNIWTAEGSPLRFTSLTLAKDLEKHLSEKLNQKVYVEVGMHYGNPSIAAALAALQSKQIDRLVVLPLFPQYSTSTTETARDQLKLALKNMPELSTSFISDYATHPDYLKALEQVIATHHSKERYLLFSFHGLPQQFADQGDPYPEQCQNTAKLLAEKLQLPAGSWSLAYQSRFGFAKWLAPYTFQTLKQLAQRGIEHISLACPGFAVDCLETLEEIQIRGKEEFLKYGGKSFHYIPALNTTEAHIEALGEIATQDHRL